MALFRAVPESRLGDANKQYYRYDTVRIPSNVPYVVDNLWEWLRPINMPSRRHAVYASPTPELALANASARLEEGDRYIACRVVIEPLAQELNKPLLVRRVSDIVSPYVGMTEQNLAHVFEQAHADEAILFLDEVDSFLQDRHKARHSWEITAVNEMLMQMEAYQGLFIASTNLMGDFDEAALRRFDLKVHFGYLKQEQVENLFNKHLKALGLEDSDQTAVLCLRHQPFLTPGDFATVLRQARFSPLATAEDLARALLAEVKHKRHLPQHPIGFVY